MAKQQGKFCFDHREAIKELELPWTELKRITTEGAPSMFGKETGLMGRIR
jgi:hypothetical protein